MRSAERGPSEWSGVWVDDDIVTAVTFNEIENRTCNRNVQRFAYVCNASESCVDLVGAGGRRRVLHGSGQVICLFFEQSPPQMEGQAATLRGSLGRKAFLDLITDSLTGPPMQFTKMPACVCVCVKYIHICVCIVCMCVWNLLHIIWYVFCLRIVVIKCRLPSRSCGEIQAWLHSSSLFLPVTDSLPLTSSPCTFSGNNLLKLTAL